MKKYNSVFVIGFSIDHNELDGSDLTAADFRQAVFDRINDLRFSDGDWELATEGPEDTYEIQEEKK